MDSVRYQVCEWRHDLEDEPIRIWSEIDTDGWEIRKVEIYRDGLVDIATFVDDVLFETGSSGLSAAPVPDVAEINCDPQFSATPRTAAEFEAIWLDAMSEPRVRADLSGSQSMLRWVEMRARVDLHLDGERNKPLWGRKNRSVVFSFSEGEDLMVEFTTVDASDIEPGATAANVLARFLGPLWMTSVVVEGAVFELWMRGVIGNGVVRRIVASPRYRRPE